MALGLCLQEKVVHEKISTSKLKEKRGRGGLHEPEKSKVTRRLRRGSEEAEKEGDEVKKNKRKGAGGKRRLRIVKLYQPYQLRGRRSRNKVSVGEPAEGSFALIYLFHCEPLPVRDCLRNCCTLCSKIRRQELGGCSGIFVGTLVLAQEQGKFWMGDIDEKFGETKGDSTKDDFF